MTTAMKNFTEHKHECELRFYTDGDVASLTEYFPGVLHLFEHQYDEDIRFWFGVVEIGCSVNAFHSARTRGEHPSCFGIQVKLPNGRIGAGRYTTWRIEQGISGERVQAAIVGYTSLAVPRS